MPCSAIPFHPFGTSCTVGPCEVRKGCGKRNAALHCSTLQSSTILSPRDVAAPVVAASYPVATARKQALLCAALPCSAVQSSTLVALRPRSGQRLPADPARKQAVQCSAVLYNHLLCRALQYIPFCLTQLLGGLLPRYGLQNLQPMRENKPCTAMRCDAITCFAMPCFPFLSAHAVNLCSHFFRLACFKLCQVVASELGPVVAKSFKHGRMHKRILHIGHVQNFGDNRH